MPRRQHEDSQYDEGRFEGREDQSWRDQSNRGSCDWERRSEDFRGESYEAGSRRYEPDYRRDESEYRGGPRYGEQQRYGGYPQSGSQDERREAQRSGREWNRPQGPYAQQPGPYWQQPQQGGYGQDRNRQSYGQQGDYASSQGSGWERGQDYGRQQGAFGGYRYDRPEYSRQQSNYGAHDQYEPFGEQRGEQRGRDEGWTDQVRHTGHQFASRVKRAFRGPKGYKRSDERIREDVSERMAQHDNLDPSDIEVRVANGEVTLTGTVRSRHEKFLAEEIADDVLGVNDVHVQLRIRRDQEQGSSSTGNQPDTSRNARA